MNKIPSPSRSGAAAFIPRAGLLLALAAALSACSTQHGIRPMFGAETPAFDARFGDAVRAARAAQTLNPQASTRNTGLPTAMDAPSAVTSVETMRGTFKAPPPTFQVFGMPMQSN